VGQLVGSAALVDCNLESGRRLQRDGTGEHECLVARRQREPEVLQQHRERNLHLEHRKVLPDADAWPCSERHVRPRVLELLVDEPTVVAWR